MFSQISLCLFLSFLLLPTLSIAGVQTYELTISTCTQNLSGKTTVDFALCVNGKIPAPTLTFTEGDLAEIRVINTLQEETSLHWHGILLPNNMDGVSYVTNLPIGPNSEFTFRFPIKQTGTYWYHSHTGLQEQQGIYGGIVIYPKEKNARTHNDTVMLLSDWTDENPNQVLKNLKKDGDYYRFKKNRFPTVWDAWQRGEFKDFWWNEWTKMGSMDLSDVGYDRFLVNGQPSQTIEGDGKESIRVRLINAAAYTYFIVEYADLFFEVIGSDGLDITPYVTKELLMGMGETYDILIKPQKGKRLELRATAQDISGYTSLFVEDKQQGDDQLVSPKSREIPSFYKMSHAGMDHSKMDHSKMDHSQHQKTENPIHPKDVFLNLEGDMDKYEWEITSEQFGPHDELYVSKGDIIRIHMKNHTMMNHPMHLHGHFFKVLNPANKNLERKHTVDVPPHQTVSIEFLADEPGYWIFHCHNLYHMKTGMMTQVTYQEFAPSSELKAIRHEDPHHKHPVYYSGMVEAFSDYAGLEFGIKSGSWDAGIAANKSYGLHDAEVEGEILYWKTYQLGFLAKVVNEGEHSGFGGGVNYLLPLRVESELIYDTLHKLSLNLEKKIPLYDKFSTNVSLRWMTNDKSEYDVELIYNYSWDFRTVLKWDGHEAHIGLRYFW